MEGPCLSAPRHTWWGAHLGLATCQVGVAERRHLPGHAAGERAVGGRAHHARVHAQQLVGTGTRSNPNLKAPALALTPNPRPNPNHAGTGTRSHGSGTHRARATDGGGAAAQSGGRARHVRQSSAAARKVDRRRRRRPGVARSWGAHRARGRGIREADSGSTDWAWRRSRRFY